MRHLLLPLALLCLALPVRADHHDGDDDGPEEREVEVRVRKGGGGGGGPGMDDDGPMGRHGSGMRRMFMSKEHHGMGGKGEPDPAMKARHEKLRGAQEKLRELKRKLHDAKESEKAALKKDVKSAVGELFDAKLAMEEAMVDKMAEHLKQKKDKLAKRKEARDKLVQERADQLTGDAPSWDD